MTLSKEKEILELFFEEPSKQWHFKEIKNIVNVADNKISKWLKKFCLEKIIQRTKIKGKAPFYISNYKLPHYQNKKKLYALNNFFKSGLMDHLVSLKDIQTIILFGSYSRSDWHKNSDIDIFIYGKNHKLNVHKFEKELKKEIQIFTCCDRKDFRKFNKGLINNIINGYLVKGNLNFLEVKLNANKLSTK